MRVLLVSHGLPPHSRGGTETYVESLALALAAAGETVRVLARERDPSLPERHVRIEPREGFDVLFINNTFADSRGFADAWKNARLGRAALPFIDAFAPDVAHVHHLTCLSTDLVAALDGRGVPVVFTLHDYWLMCQRGQLLDREWKPCDGPAPDRCASCLGVSAEAGPFLARAAQARRAIARWLPGPLPPVVRAFENGAAKRPAAGVGAAALSLRLSEVRELALRARCFLCPSETMAERMGALGVDPSKLLRQPLGIDHRPFLGLRRKLSPTGRFGFLGSLMVSKAPHLFLEAFRSLPAARASAHLFGDVVSYHGDDSYRGVLGPLLAAPGVRLHGPFPHSEVARVLAALDVLVVPSVWLENSPLVVREAALAGIPVVASDLGGLRELVRHGVDGLLFPPGDVGALAGSMRRFLDEPDLLPRLRGGLRKPLTIEADAEAVRGVYRRVAAARCAPAQPPKLVAVVLNYRTLARTLACVASLEQSERRPDAVLVVDNDSADGSAAFLAPKLGPDALLHTEKNLGFSGGVNAGISEALARGARQVLLLNGDIGLAPRSIGVLEAALDADPSLGVVGPVVLSRANPSVVETDGISWDRRTGRMRHPGFGARYEPERRQGVRPVDGVSGACVLLSRRLIEAVGPFAPEYFFTFEDLELCLRARAAGFGVGCVEEAVAFHDGGASLSAHAPRRSYFAVRNHLMLARDHAPGSRPERLGRAATIVALNAAHVLLRSGVPKVEGMAALVRGVLDFARGRSGPGE